jgi:cell division protein FtsB
MSYTHLALSLRRFLNHPGRVAVCCLIFFTLSIIVNGNIFRLWSMHRDYDRIESQIKDTRKSISHLAGQLKLAKDPTFIERQARDKLDMAGEDDLVFVFPD